MGTDLVPLIPSDTEEPDVAGMLRAWDRAESTSQILKTSIWFVTAGAIVFAVLSAGNPLVLFAKARASLIGTSAPQDGAGQPTPMIQTTADRQVLPPTARDVPKGDEMASPREAADQKSDRSPSAASRRFAEATPGLGGRGRCTGKGRACTVCRARTVRRARTVCKACRTCTACTRFPNTGCARARTAGPARAKAPANPSFAKCAGRDPARAECPCKGPVRKKRRSRYAAHSPDQSKPAPA